MEKCFYRDLHSVNETGDGRVGIFVHLRCSMTYDLTKDEIYKIKENGLCLFLTMQGPDPVSCKHPDCNESNCPAKADLRE